MEGSLEPAMNFDGVNKVVRTGRFKSARMMKKR